MDKVAIITGVGGQDGRFLAKHLLEQGFEVIGINRRSSQPRDYLHNLVQDGLKVIEGDITDASSMEKIIKQYQPYHFYGLAAQSHVGTSFQEPLHTFDATGKAVFNILEAIKNVSNHTRFYNAASSEMFGSMYSKIEVIEGYYKGISYFNGKEPEPYKSDDYTYSEAFQNEETPFRPQSPYGIAKLAGYHATRLYRESYNLFACSGILFNHESELRSLTFVTRKITNYVSRLRLAKEKGKTIEKLKLGNLDAKRDWSHASDMVRAMYMMLEHSIPDDFVVGSGQTYSVREFAAKAFDYIGESWMDHIEIDSEFMRPAEVDYLRADPSKAKKILGWEPLVSFDGLVQKMIDNDIERTNTKYKVYGDI